MDFLTPIRSLYRRVTLGQRVPLSQLHGTWNCDSRIDSKFEEKLLDLQKGYSDEQTEAYHRVHSSHDGNFLKSYVDREFIRIYYPNGSLDYAFKSRFLKTRPLTPLYGRIRDIPRNLVVGPWTGNVDIQEYCQELTLRFGRRCSFLISRSKISRYPAKRDTEQQEFMTIDRVVDP